MATVVSLNFNCDGVLNLTDILSPVAFSIFHLVPEENIATMKYGAQVVKGELKSALLDGDTQNYDLDHGFSRHPIDDDCRSGIEIKLGQPSIINHIRILLWDRDSR